MRCVDSCFIIDLLPGTEEARHKAKALDAEGGAGSTAIPVFEVWVGIQTLSGSLKTGRTA